MLLLVLPAIGILFLGAEHARASGGTPCLRPEVAPRIEFVLGLKNGSAVANASFLGDILIGRHSVRVSLTTEPDCTLVLSHPTAMGTGPRVATSESFLLSSLHSQPSRMCRDRLREVAAIITARDIELSIWSRCGSATGQAQELPTLLRARSHAVASVSLRTFRFWVAGCFLLALVFLALVLGFQSRLHRRAVGLSASLVPHSSEPAHGGVRARLMRASPWLAFGVIVLGGWDIGFNNEMTSGFYLHPYRLLNPSGADWESPTCSSGLFRQRLRPELGLCGSGRERPLLNSAYSIAVTYWPFTEIARALPFFGGDPLRFLLLPIIALIFWVLGRLLTVTMAPPALIALTPWVMVFFPISSIYATPYLFEYLPQALLLLAWWLLWRWNGMGGAWRPILAALLLGLAVAQKLTFVLVVVPFSLAFGLFFGLRRIRVPHLLLCSAATCLAPVLLLLANLLADPTLARMTDTPRHTVGPWIGLLSFSHQLFSPSLEPGSLAVAVPYLVLLLGLLLYAVWKVWQYRVRSVASPTPAFLSVVILVLLPSMALLYRLNPTSSPLLQILPIPAVVIAAALLDGWTWSVARLGGARRWVLPICAAGLVLWGLHRVWSFHHWLDSHPAHLRRSEQKRIVDRLEALGATSPILLASYYHGVFELLSRGRVRPVYVVEEGFDRKNEKDWMRILRRTANRSPDFLFSTEPFGSHRVVQGHRPDWEVFLRAVRSSCRTLDRQVDLPTRNGRVAFILFRLRAVSPGDRCAPAIDTADLGGRAASRDAP